jgi:hypothetical protein
VCVCGGGGKMPERKRDGSVSEAVSSLSHYLASRYRKQYIEMVSTCSRYPGRTADCS